MPELTIEEQIEKARNDLKRFKAAGSQARLHQILERDGAHDMLRQLKHKLKKDINPKLLRERALKQYSQCVKRVSYQSAYVLTFEARMCRSLHIMAILEEQLGLTKEECKKRIEVLENTGTEEKEEELHVEMRLVNDLVAAENSKRELEDAYKEILKKQEVALNKLEREAWGRSLAEFSVDDSSFVLPSISEEQSNEGRLSAMLDHTLAQPPGTFKVDDVSLGTAEMGPPPPSGKDLLPPLGDEYSSDDDAYPERGSSSSDDDYSGHDELEKAADADAHDDYTTDEDEAEYSDSSSEGDHEFLSPEEADFDTEYPWRKYHSKSHHVITDDEDGHHDYNNEDESDLSGRERHGDEDESEFSRRERYDNEDYENESEYARSDRYDDQTYDEESEFSRSDRYEQEYEEESEVRRRDQYGNYDDKTRDDETEYTGYDDETEYTDYPNPEDTEAGESEDDEVEFLSPDEAPPPGTPNPWRRSSNEDAVGAVPSTTEKENENDVNGNDIPENKDGSNHRVESHFGQREGADDNRSEDSEEKRYYAKKWGNENGFQDSYQESMEESWKEVSDRESSSSESDYSDSESESSSESWGDRASEGIGEAENEEDVPLRRTAEMNRLAVSDTYDDELSQSQESETSSRHSASESASESSRSSVSRTEYDQSLSTFSEEPRGYYTSNGLLKKEVALNAATDSQRDREYDDDDESPRSVTDMAHLSREPTQRFSNSSSQMHVDVPAPVPEEPEECPTHRNVVNQFPERRSRSPGPSLLQRNEPAHARWQVNRNVEIKDSEEDRPNLKATFSDRFNEKYPRSESVDRSVGSSSSKKLDSPGRGHRRPLLSKTFSSQGLIRHIENQSWCSAELTKHALVDDEGWELDRGQGRIAPLAKHRLIAFQDAESVESSRVS